MLVTSSGRSMTSRLSDVHVKKQDLCWIKTQMRGGSCSPGGCFCVHPVDSNITVFTVCSYEPTVPLHVRWNKQRDTRGPLINPSINKPWCRSSAIGYEQIKLCQIINNKLLLSEGEQSQQYYQLDSRVCIFFPSIDRELSESDTALSCTAPSDLVVYIIVKMMEKWFLVVAVVVVGLLFFWKALNSEQVKSQMLACWCFFFFSVHLCFISRHVYNFSDVCVSYINTCHAVVVLSLIVRPQR